jgi:hypothetical protein
MSAVCGPAQGTGGYGSAHHSEGSTLRTPWSSPRCSGIRYKGFALTTPTDWLAWQPSTGWQDWWLEDDGRILGLEPMSDVARNNEVDCLWAAEAIAWLRRNR